MGPMETATPGAVDKRAEMARDGFHQKYKNGISSTGPMPHQIDATGCSKTKTIFRFIQFLIVWHPPDCSAQSLPLASVLTSVSLHGCSTRYWATRRTYCSLVSPFQPLAALQLLDAPSVLTRPGGYRAPSQLPSSREGTERSGIRRVASRVPSI